jgi:hypothetical protein
MGFRKVEDCQKGDMCSFEILVERSSTKNHRVDTLWKRENDKFQIALYDRRNIRTLRKYSPDQISARQAYEDFCEEYECLPYPEADSYYMRKE